MCVYNLPAIEETLIMMPPSFPCSLLMCSSAKYVPLITDVYTEKDGQGSCAGKVRKYLLLVSVSYQVDLNGLAPVLLIVDAGIVDNDVQLTKCVHCPLERI